MKLDDTFAVVVLLATPLFVANNGFFEEILSRGQNLPEPKKEKRRAQKIGMERQRWSLPSALLKKVSNLILTRHTFRTSLF